MVQRGRTSNKKTHPVLYSKADQERLEIIDPDGNGRSEFRRDYTRLIHSSAFRRLQGKTQLFPGKESDFFRNRLTHSLEVAQIAKSIAIQLNKTTFRNSDNQIDTDLVEFAALAHDLGHPPFGHNGERALNICMRDYGGFEGNAQTIRVITCLEKKQFRGQMPVENGHDNRIGLNPAFRSIGAVLKYDFQIPERFEEGESEPVKGYYAFDAPLIQQVKQAICGDAHCQDFRTIECSIMDIADDIAFSTYDLEDALKAEFLSPLEILSADPQLIEKIAKKASKKLANPDITPDIVGLLLNRIFDGIFTDYQAFVRRQGAESKSETVREEYLRLYTVNVFALSQQVCKSGYYRTRLTSSLVHEALSNLTVSVDKHHPALSRVNLEPNVGVQVEILKTFVYESVIKSPRVQVVESRGFDIVKRIFDKLANEREGGERFLPPDVRQLFHAFDGNKGMQMRVICDFVAGMTDRYAVEFYQRLFSVDAETIFKSF